VTRAARSFVYYLSKYWELLDSLFQVQKAQSLGSKGSSPTFLHYYHHAAVMVSLPHNALPTPSAQEHHSSCAHDV
jgi:hypothetical protein